MYRWHSALISGISQINGRHSFHFHLIYLCPQLRRSWRGILVSGCPCVRASVRACVRSIHAFHILWTVHARVLKFHIWIPHGKIADTRFFFFVFFFLTSYLPFWSYAPLKKIRMKSDACHILWTVHDRVLKFHIWIPRGKIADPYFFLVRVISLSGVTPLWNKSPKGQWSLTWVQCANILSFHTSQQVKSLKIWIVFK